MSFYYYKYKKNFLYLIKLLFFACIMISFGLFSEVKIDAHADAFSLANVSQLSPPSNLRFTTDSVEYPDEDEDEDDKKTEEYDYFVDATKGEDSNSGSNGTPFRTIQKAVDAAGPGDRIFIREGVYQESITMKTSGTNEDRIVFAGERGPNGEYLTIIDPGTPVSGWEPAPEVGAGVYKVDLGFDPREMTVDGMRIGRLNNNRMAGQSGSYGTGFEMMDHDSDYVIPSGNYSGELFWDGIEALYGYLNGTTYLRFRDRGEDLSQRTIRAAPQTTLIDLENVSYITVKDIKTQGAAHGFNLEGSDCHHNIIEDCFISGGNRRVLILHGTHNNIVRNNINTMNYIAPEYLGPDHRRIYAFFKYDIGTATSDDMCFLLHGLGNNNIVEGNKIFEGLIGLTASGGIGNEPTNGLFVRNNLFYNLSSVGLTVNHSIINWEISGNLFYNSKNKIRLHNLNVDYELGREVYIFNNRFYGPGENFRFHTPLVEEPPDYFPKFFIYHNSFADGFIGYTVYLEDAGGLPDFHFINNIYSGSMTGTSLTNALENEDFGSFGPNWIGGTVGGAAPHLEAYGSTVHDGVWFFDTSDPDWFDYSVNPDVENSGLDLSEPFEPNDNQVLPGMKVAYSEGMIPLGIYSIYDPEEVADPEPDPEPDPLPDPEEFSVDERTLHLATKDGEAMFFHDSLDFSDWAGELGDTSFKVIFEDDGGNTASAYCANSGNGESLGDELITDGSFSEGYTHWDEGSGWSVENGNLCHDGTSTSGHAAQHIGFTSLSLGSISKLQYDVVNFSGSPVLRFFSPFDGYFVGGHEVGEHSEILYPDGSYHFFALRNSGPGTTICLNNISIRKINDVPSTGLHLVSSKNGSTRNMTHVDEGFNPNTIVKVSFFRQ